tara:strand:+ start:264 stop:1085 length:822 start_codon:yes stop_codon:yes gene_type:complete
MKSTYIYFGTKGYHYEKDTSGDQEVGGDSATSLTLAGAGLLPVDHANTASDDSTSLDAYRIVIKAAATTTGDRANNNTTDFLTGGLFTAATGSTGNVEDVTAGDVTVLRRQDYDVANSSQITIITASGAVGYDIQNNDELWVEQVARHDAAGNGPSAGSTLSMASCYPMFNYMGANPVAFAGNHYDGTALDQTDLHFAKRGGANGTDIIRLIHTAGAYPNIVKTMEAIYNSGVYNRAITFYDLDTQGVETFVGGPSLSGNRDDMRIYGCWRTA